MDFFDTIKKRRSIRRFTDQAVPAEVIEKSLQAALLAPNSSNSQTWDFYWVQSADKKNKLIDACLSQSAARTAAELIVAVASPESWRRSQPELADYAKSVNAPKSVLLYYNKLFPLMYKSDPFGFTALIKTVSFFAIGLFRPIMRRPATLRDIQEVCIKSTALACENFVLAVSAQGYASCMMEGFDEVRVKRILQLRRKDRVVMVIAVGAEAERGTWGPQFRIGSSKVIHRV